VVVVIETDFVDGSREEAVPWMNVKRPSGYCLKPGAISLKSWVGVRVCV